MSRKCRKWKRRKRRKEEKEEEKEVVGGREGGICNALSSQDYLGVQDDKPDLIYRAGIIGTEMIGKRVLKERAKGLIL